MTTTKDPPQVSRKRKHADKKSDGPSVQIAFRCPTELAERVEKTAFELGLDTSGLIRMLLLEHLPEYEARADRIHGRTSPD